MKYAALLLNFKLEGKCKQWYKWYQSGSCVPSNSHPFSQGANTSSTDMPGLDKSARKSFTDPLPPTRCSVSNTALSLSRQVFFLLGPFYQHSPKYQLSSRCSPVSLLLHRSVGAGGRGGRQQQASTKDAHRKSSSGTGHLGCLSSRQLGCTVWGNQRDQRWKVTHGAHPGRLRSFPRCRC